MRAFARRISAEGKLVKLGRQTSYAEAFVRDGAGNLAVHAHLDLLDGWARLRERNKMHLSQAADAII